MYLFQVAVDDVDTQIKGLRFEFELKVHLDQPVNEDGTHFFIDVLLLAHVRGCRTVASLLLAEMAIDIVHVCRAHLRVFSIGGIDVDK